MIARPADITIMVPGAIKPKSRHRVRVRRNAVGGYSVQSFADPKTKSYEGTLRLFGNRAMKAAGIAEPIEGACHVRLTATFGVPPSWSQKKRLKAIAGEVPHVVRPDGDNLLKILDGLNQVTWRDDCQVTQWEVIKRYGETENLLIQVWRRATP